MKRLILMMTMCMLWASCVVEGEADETEAEMALITAPPTAPVETERCYGDPPDGCAPPPVQVAKPLCERMLDCGPP